MKSNTIFETGAITHDFSWSVNERLARAQAILSLCAQSEVGALADQALPTSYEAAQKIVGDVITDLNTMGVPTVDQAEALSEAISLLKKAKALISLVIHHKTSPSTEDARDLATSAVSSLLQEAMETIEREVA